MEIWSVTRASSPYAETETPFKLPPGARAVFVLHDVEGYKHDEIAELIGVATGTSKAQLHRARRLLREVLDR